MSLHRALRSDWSEIPPQERNIWQRWAAASIGVCTPGNLVSIIGAVVVCYGLLLLYRGHLERGVIWVIVGRLADVLDGSVAEYTKTKSPLGEGVDATVDKILIILSLYVLIDKTLIPSLAGYIMLLHAIYVVAVSSLSRRFKTFIHPSRAGKLGTAFEWAAIALYVLSDILRQHHVSTNLLGSVAGITFALYIVLATWSSITYTQTLYYKRTMSS
jgi:phosphatidylglycerophosphate synthase